MTRALRRRVRAMALHGRGAGEPARACLRAGPVRTEWNRSYASSQVGGSLCGCAGRTADALTRSNSDRSQRLAWLFTSVFDFPPRRAPTGRMCINLPHGVGEDGARKPAAASHAVRRLPYMAARRRRRHPPPPFCPSEWIAVHLTDAFAPQTYRVRRFAASPGSRAAHTRPTPVSATHPFPTHPHCPYLRSDISPYSVRAQKCAPWTPPAQRAPQRRPPDPPHARAQHCPRTSIRRP